MDKIFLRKAIHQKIASRKVQPQTLLERLKPFLHQNVLSYFPLGKELDISVINQFLFDQGRLFFPKVMGNELKICRATQLEPFHTDLLGTRICDKWEIASLYDLNTLLIPAVAVDLSFQRLGRGGGFYDRLLAKIDSGIPRLTIIYKEQLVETLPVDFWIKRSIKFLFFRSNTQ